MQLLDGIRDQEVWRMGFNAVLPYWMDADPGIFAAEKSTHAHYRTACADSGNESVGHASGRFQLQPNLGSGGGGMRSG